MFGHVEIKWSGAKGNLDVNCKWNGASWVSESILLYTETSNIKWNNILCDPNIVVGQVCECVAIVEYYVTIQVFCSPTASISSFPQPCNDDNDIPTYRVVVNKSPKFIQGYDQTGCVGRILPVSGGYFSGSSCNWNCEYLRSGGDHTKCCSKSYGGVDTFIFNISCDPLSGESLPDDINNYDFITQSNLRCFGGLPGVSIDG